MTNPSNVVAGTLCQKKCKPCEGGTPPVPDDEARAMLAGLPGWELKDRLIEKTYRFANHYQAIAFVNAVAWVSHAEDHHPVLEVGYNHCTVRYWTHAVGGLSENDFICAAKVDSLIDPRYK